MHHPDEVRVLVVDDRRDEAESLAALLRLGGYVVRTVTRAVDALEVMASFQPLCLLLDIDMPDMDGLELSRRLRQSQVGNELVIIAVSGWDAGDFLQPSFECVDHFLPKPVDPARLARLLPPLTD
ncbi:MAG TPA: response regulator [Rubrivivax sp.]